LVVLALSEIPWTDPQERDPTFGSESAATG